MVGVGSQSALTKKDSDDALLAGRESYRLTLPPEVPVKTSGRSSSTTLRRVLNCRRTSRSRAATTSATTSPPNDDASGDILFGPGAPSEDESNWIQTVPGKGWFATLRLYGPQEPCSGRLPRSPRGHATGSRRRRASRRRTRSRPTTGRAKTVSGVVCAGLGHGVCAPGPVPAHDRAYGAASRRR
jgi:hypothetical protein